MTDDREKRTEDGKQKTEKGGGKSAGRGSVSVLRRLVKWGLLTVGGSLLLIILLWGLLQTPWARSGWLDWSPTSLPRRKAIRYDYKDSTDCSRFPSL